MIGATELKRGEIVDIDGAPWQVMDVNMQTPSARGASMLVKAKLKNLKTGQSLAKTFRGADVLPTLEIEKRSVQYLYRDGDDLAFMDLENYDQFTLPVDTLGEAAGYLTDGLECRSILCNGELLTIELPIAVELEIVDTPPAMKGATAQAQLKLARLSTGIEVLVPPYLSAGERIRVDTRDNRFLERAK